MQEKIIETKICKQCNKKFNITKNDVDFYEKMSPVFAGEKLNIPFSNHCHDCKFQNRLTWKNLRNLYKINCSATGKQIISMYSPDKNYIIYNLDFWWSDKWDVMDFSLDINFEKNFFNQFEELLKIVPKRPLVKGTGTENCDYTNCIGASKNSYLIFDSVNCNNCFYGSGLITCNDCFDCALTRNSEHSYMLFNCINCYDSSYLIHSVDCSQSSYLYNCKNCNNCFGCVNLNNKSYYIFNKPYSKEEYNIELEKLKNKGYDLKQFLKYVLNFPVVNLNIINSENVSGDNICNSKNIIDSFDIYDSENIYNSYFCHSGASDCLDVEIVLNNSSRAYDCSLLNKSCTNILFSYDCWNNCENLIYCSECKLTKDCFMCNGLVGKQYCILNKQYSKHEYEQLVLKIIKKMQLDSEWGEFFPASLSAFGYNESYAQEFFPLTKQQALEQGFKWSEYQTPFPNVEKIIPANKLPDNIDEIPDDILNWAIECEITKKPFRILEQELEFYRKHNLPIPRRHPDQRHLDRMSLRNPRKLFDRKCDKCGIEMKTSYPPEKKQIVYCQKCYEKELY